MNIKRPSESWEILSDGLWFDWEEFFKKTARTAHLRPIPPGGSFLDIANLALLKIQQSAFDDVGRK